MALNPTAQAYFSQGRQTPNPSDPNSIVRGLAGPVAALAKRIRREPSWCLEDLVQIGLMAALESAKTYRPGLSSFGTYATTSALRAMRKAAIEGRGPVRVPYASWRDARQLGTELMTGRVSLDQPASESSKATLGEMTPGKDCPETTARVLEIVARMPPRERRYLLGEAQGRTLREMAAEEGVSFELINHRRAVAVARAKESR